MVNTEFRFPKSIILYDGVKLPVQVEEIANYLSNNVNKARVECRGDIVVHYLAQFSGEEKEQKAHDLAMRFAQTKVCDLNKKIDNGNPLLGEIGFEAKWLLKQPEKPLGILYDADKLQRLLFDLLPQSERNLDCLHIVILSQLFGTWDEANHRYHARVSDYGFPCVISIAGMVEAPAKPREYYLKQKAGIDPWELKREFHDRFIDYDDPRMTELVKGYVMQAVFYHLTGIPFCRDSQCRLFNAHWQEELIGAQLDSQYEFCSLHKEILESII